MRNLSQKLSLILSALLFLSGTALHAGHIPSILSLGNATVQPASDEILTAEAWTEMGRRGWVGTTCFAGGGCAAVPVIGFHLSYFDETGVGLGLPLDVLAQGLPVGGQLPAWSGSGINPGGTSFFTGDHAGSSLDGGIGQ